MPPNARRAGLRQPGGYLLVLHLAEPAGQSAAGWYVYAGSALNGLEQRVARHIRGSSVRHWHVDRLRAVASLREVWLLHSSRRLECALASRMQGDAVPGFGSSDCRCRTHLYHSLERPVCGMALAVRSVMDDHATIQAAFDSPEAAGTAADELRRYGFEPRVASTTLEMNASPDAQAMLQRLGANLRNVAMAYEQRHLSSDSPALAHDPLVPGS